MEIKEWARKKLTRLRPAQVVVLMFLGIIVLGTVLLSLPFASRSGSSCGMLTALFTATSATCVTGLSLVDSYTQWSPFGQIVLLAMIQVGGLGFMTILSLFMQLLHRKLGLRQQLIIAQGLGLSSLADVAALVRHIMIGTAIFEAAGALILGVRFGLQYGPVKGIWLGIFHSVSAFCNAGFDLLGFLPTGGSLLSYSTDPVVQITVMALIVVGGLGFLVWEDLWEVRSLRRLNYYSKLVLRMTAVLIVGGAVLFAGLEWNNPATLGTMTTGEKLLAALFQSVTTRTAGFCAVDQGALTDASKAVTIVLMLIGGSSGSTAGGMKTVTIAVLIFSMFATFRGASRVTYCKRTIPQAYIMQAVSLFGLMLGSALLGSVLICTFDAISFLDALYETGSALGTVGLSTGITASLSVASKLMLIVFMFFGRVGIMTIGFGFLLKKSATERYRYADATIMIG